MRILLTGGTGWLGSYLAKALVKSGHSVLALCRETSSQTLVGALLENPRFELVCLPASGVSEFVASLEPRFDVVVHTATNYGRSATPINEIVESNVTFPLQVLRGAVRNGARLFINTDSYFNKEGLSYFALPDYSLTKKAFLEWLKFESRNIRIVNMRLEHVYGPRDASSKFVPSMLRAISSSEAQEIALTLGTQERDFVWIDDVVRAFQLVIENLELKEHETFKEYEIGTGHSTPVSQIPRILKALFSSEIELKFGALGMREDEIMKSVSSPKFQADFDWHPLVALEDGLTRLFEAVKQKGESDV